MMIEDFKETLTVTEKKIALNGTVIPRSLSETTTLKQLWRTCLSLENLLVHKNLIREINRLLKLPGFKSRFSGELFETLNQALIENYGCEFLESKLKELDGEWRFDHGKNRFEKSINKLKVGESQALLTLKRKRIKVTRLGNRALKVKLTPSLSVVIDASISAVPSMLFVGVSINAASELIKDVLINEKPVDECAAAEALNKYEPRNNLSNVVEFKRRLLLNRLTELKVNQSLERTLTSGTTATFKRASRSYVVDTSLGIVFRMQPRRERKLMLSEMAEFVLSQDLPTDFRIFCSKVMINKKAFDPDDLKVRNLVTYCIRKNVSPNVGALMIEKEGV